MAWLAAASLAVALLLVAWLAVGLLAVAFLAVASPWAKSIAVEPLEEAKQAAASLLRPSVRATFLALALLEMHQRGQLNAASAMRSATQHCCWDQCVCTGAH